MTDVQREAIQRLRMDGKGYTAIAKATGLSKESVKEFCKRNGLGGVASALTVSNTKTKWPAGKGKSSSSTVCPSCGNPITQTPGCKPRRFCSDVCRLK